MHTTSTAGIYVIWIYSTNRFYIEKIEVETEKYKLKLKLRENEILLLSISEENKTPVYLAGKNKRFLC